MKYKTLTILFLSVTLFGGCFNNRCTSGEPVCAVVDGADAPIRVDDSSFSYFVQSIPLLDSTFSFSNKRKFEHVDLQSKFIPKGAALIGKLPSIENYAFILYSYPADLRLPFLEVYNSQGEKVNERILYKFDYCSTDFEDNHIIETSPDKTKIYMTTVCVISFSAFDYDSIVVKDLLYH